jgi:hypothetical protein
MRIERTAAIEERDSTPCTDEEIETYALRIALLVAMGGDLERFCERIDSLLEGAGRKS